MLETPRVIDPSRRRPLWLDLGAVVGLVLWFYWPFLTPGIPAGDFASDVMVAEARPDLFASPTSLTTWNPNLMCGRPTIGFAGPFQLLHLPFQGLEPVLRLKALALFYHVLAGLAMYGLLVASRAGRDAALFAGLVYPIMTSHVSRTAIHGHIHVVMLYALLPIFFLAFFRLRPRSYRAMAILALVLAACLLRDVQRSLLLVVMVGMALGVGLLATLPAAVRRRSLRPMRRQLWVAGLFAAAFVLAVAVESFELVNGHRDASERAGWRSGEQEYWIERWSLDNLYSLVDRDAWLGTRMRKVSPLFRASRSRYLGLSLVALILLGAIERRGLSRRHHRHRFGFTLMLLGMSLWLSFGAKPVIGAERARWSAVFASPAVSPGLKVCVLGSFLLLLGLAIAAVAAQVRFRRHRIAASAALVAIVSVVLLTTAPLPVVRRLVFFLRDFRNPDWFGVTVLSFATAFAAALSVAALASRWRRWRWWPAVHLGIIVAASADFLPYRAHLTAAQRSATALATYRQANLVIAGDLRDVRVMPASPYSNVADLGFIWHRKRLAWDFRSYAAPRRTGTYFNTLYGLLQTGASPDHIARMAGLASVGFIVDERGHDEDLRPSALLVPIVRTSRVWIFENRACRPFVQAYPEAAVLVGDPANGALLAADLAEANVGLVHPEAVAQALELAVGRRVFAGPEMALREDLPRHTLFLGRGTATVQRATFATTPDLAWERPRPDEIRITTRSGQDFFMVVAESYHTGWTGRLDGEPLALYPGAYAFLGAFVPAGEHEIRLRFLRPASYYLWGVVSLIALAGLLGGIAITGRRRGPAAARGRAALAPVASAAGGAASSPAGAVDEVA